MTVLSFLCPFEHQGPCFGRVDGRCRILREYDYRWKHCPFQKPGIKSAGTEEPAKTVKPTPIHGTETCERAASLIRSGVAIYRVAGMLGVSEHTIYNWRRKGWI